MCSTHCKESRDTWFVNFGQVFDFILILQVVAEIWNLNLNLKTNFDSVDQGADKDCDVAARYWSIPIRVCGSNLGRAMQIWGQEKKKREWSSPAWRTSATTALVLDGGGVLASGYGDGVVDEVRMTMVTSKSWTAASISSQIEAEGRLESTMPSGASDIRQRRGFCRGNAYVRWSEGAHEWEEREGSKSEGVELLHCAITEGVDGRNRELRRAISRRRRRLRF
jgi:hypothetical protein